MILKLTHEMKEALRTQTEEPLEIEDDETNKTYLLVEKEQVSQLFDQWLRRELQIGFDQADTGDLVSWNPEKIKAEGRKRLAEQKS